MAQPAPSAAPPVSGRQAAATAGAPGKQVAEVPPPVARATAEAAIVAAFVAFLAAARQQDGRWLINELRGASGNEVARVVAEEDRRGREFAEAATRRVTGELGAVLAIPDRQLRETKMRLLLEREKRFARQHSEAMAARGVAAVARIELRRSSPAGAYWKLDPTVKEHTPGCLFLGEHFWPWAVLDRVHPPRHAGCPCKLLGYHEAITAGLMVPEDVPDTQIAVRRAAGVVMEAAVAERIMGELQLRDALVEAGVPAGRLAMIELAA